MIEEVINSIIEAENKANDIEKEAKLKSREILQKAELDALEIVKDEKDSVMKDIQKTELDALAISNKNNKKILDKALNDASKLREDVYKNMLKAKDIIKKGILKKYGCC